MSLLLWLNVGSDIFLSPPAWTRCRWTVPQACVECSNLRAFWLRWQDRSDMMQQMPLCSSACAVALHVREMQWQHKCQQSTGAS